MNRGYSYTPRGQTSTPPHRDRLRLQDPSLTSRSQNQASKKQDLNIDDFGDMGSDEDDFQAVGSNFVPPKPPAQPQYNLVPYGFLRDDDELVEEDYDGVPIDDSVLLDSPKKQPWQSSPKPQSEIRGDPITVLGSRSRLDSHLPQWANDKRSQDRAPRSHSGLGNLSVDSNISKIRDSNQQVRAGRWDKKDPVINISSGNTRNTPALMGMDCNVGKVQAFIRAQDEANPFIQSGNRQTSSLSFDRANEEGNPFMKTSNKPTTSDSTARFVQGTGDSSRFIKSGNKHNLSKTATSFVSAKDISSNILLQSRDNTPGWNDRPKPAQSSAPVWSERGRESSQSLKAKVQPGQNQMFPPTNVVNTPSQLEMLQAAALQQALTGLTHLGSQSGLNLIGAQNLLMQATQNPALAAALVGTGGILSTGLNSIQPNTLNTPAVEALLKSAVTTPAPDVTQSNLGLLMYPVRSNIAGNSSSMPRKKLIPDGSGASRYPAPDVSSLVFDPVTGYRFDASTGLHYDANSGYFFNSELKLYLRWDKFTQTYLKVDNPPGVPRLNTPSAERMSYMKEPSLASQDEGQQSSSFSNTPFPKDNIRSSSTFSTGSSTTNSRDEYSNIKLAPLMSIPTASFRREGNTVHPSISTIQTDFSKPPPSHPQTPFSDTRLQEIGANASKIAEQKLAALPNFAETSLFNKLRKAKLAQTAQTKCDRKRWGSPDPLLEAAQKQLTAETNRSEEGILNLKEILQRSRQFMKKKTGNALDGNDEAVDRQPRRDRSRSRSGDQRRIRSRSRSAGKPLRRSRSSERHGKRRVKSSTSPKQRRPLARSPDSRLRGRRPNSRGRSPNSRVGGRTSPSPSGKRRSPSRGHSPLKRAHGKASPSPEAKKKKPSRGRSPLGRRGKPSKSPDPRQRRPISKGRSPERSTHGRLSISPEHGKRVLLSRTQGGLLKRSQSPKMKVVLDQNHEGSKVRAHSPEENSKRSVDQGLSAGRRTLGCKVSPSNVKSPERTRILSPGRINEKDSVEGKDRLAVRKPVRERLGVRENKRESLEKDKITELKPIPYDSPQSSGKKSSGKNRDMSGYKSLSNLRNQGKGKPRGSETAKQQDSSRQNKDKSDTSRLLAEVDLTAGSDDEKRSRANYRLVSERTFSSGWERKKPASGPQVVSTKKTNTKTESPPKETKTESGISAEDTKECIDEEDINKQDEIEGGKQLEESNEFDFLNDTLDDDKESTVIDEYEEILDYQDLDGTSELLVEESAANHTPEIQGLERALSKESLGSPVIDLCIDPEEHAIEASTSAESHLESVQCSSVEESDLAEIPSGKLDSLADGAVVAEDGEDADVLTSGVVRDENIDGIELRDSENLEVVNKSIGVSTEVSDSQSLKDRSWGAKEIKELAAAIGEISGKEGSRKSDHVPTGRDETFEVKPETKEDGKESNAGDRTATEMADSPNDKAVESENDKRAPDELGSEIVDSGEWNIVDSVNDQEEVTKETISSAVNESSSSTSTKRVGLKILDLVKTNNLSAKRTNLELQNENDYESGVTQNAAAAKSEESGKNIEFGSKASKVDIKNDELSPRVKKDDSPTVSKGDDEPNTLVSKNGGAAIGKNSWSEAEEPQVQVRSVSDIEKFLLLSSQEVEAKREQGIEPTTKTDKKSGVFSRLGGKLPSEDAGGEPTVVLELPAETSLSSPGPSNKFSASAIKPLQRATKAKPTAASNTLNKSKKASPEDPVGMLFNDKPTRQILIGPMNFIEPLQNFQQFTQRYMQRLLQQEGVKFRKVHVCHEDGTGAPYHYILIVFHSVGAASAWFKKNKGRFKGDEKLFKRVAGHTKQKFIPGAETFLHFSESNWICKICKRGNFPPRSLCFGCFQHKDSEGFSPITILDKGPPPYKPSIFVGTPKLKFFVTKEKVIESAPPLDGFDIKNIVMIMDEKMGFPAGICVFEMSNMIDAGKLKKYLNHRDVEAVSVEMHENPDSTKTGPQIAPSRKIPPREIRDEHSPKSLPDNPFSASGMHRRPFVEGEGPRRYLEGRGVQESSLRFPSQEVRVPKGRSPGSSQEVRVPRVHSPSPPREVRVSRGRSPSPFRGIRLPRGRSPSPIWEARVPRGRSPSPLRSRLSRDRVQSRSPRHVSQNRCPSPESGPIREIPSRSRTVRELSPRYDTADGPRRYRSRERNPGYISPVPYRSPGYQSPPRYRSRSPVYDTPRRWSPSPRHRPLRPSPPLPSPVRPIKPDGRGDGRYPPPDPTNFRFEPRSGLDYDPTTTLYYEPKSCCFYNDDTNEWLEYDPRTGRYILVR